MSDGVDDVQESDREDEHSLLDLLERLHGRLEGLREVLDVTSPHVSALDESSNVERIIENAGLEPEAEELARSLFLGAEVRVSFGPPRLSPSRRVAFTDGDGEADDSEPDEEEQVNEAEEDEEDTGDEKAKEDEEVGGSIAQTLNDLQRISPSGFRTLLGQLTRANRVPRASLLNQSLLAVAIATFEVLLAGLFREHLVRFPGQVDQDEKEFSLADLIELGSVEEARRLLIDQKTESFMRRSFADWSRWSERTIGASFDTVALDRARFHEQFQRRHLIVHTGGLVNRLYLERVDFGDDTPPEEGTELAVTSEYLRSALEEIEVVGTSLVCVAMAKWTEGGPEMAAATLNRAAYEAMGAERWPLAVRFCDVGKDLDCPAEFHWMIKVNSWIAERRLSEDPMKCRKEIEAWDVSALEPKFKLARAALLEETDEVFRHLPEVAKRESTAARELWQWPLLAGYIDDPRFAEAMGNRLPPGQTTEIEQIDEPGPENGFAADEGE